MTCARFLAEHGFRRLNLVKMRAIRDLVRSHVLVTLWRAKRGTALGELVAARPEVWHLLEAPFVHARWTAAERLQRLIEHCAIVDQLGKPFDLPPDRYVDLLDLQEIGVDYHLKLDSPPWIFRDGVLTLSLWQEPDRLFNLIFLFGRVDGELIAYVGGIQGRPGEDARAQYRAFARAAADMRPQYVLVELFRRICAHLGVKRILAVTNETRHQRSAYFTDRDDWIDPVSFNYDAFWEERGGRRVGDMFELSVGTTWRAESSIPARKRARHRERRRLLGLWEARLVETLARPDNIEIKVHALGTSQA